MKNRYEKKIFDSFENIDRNIDEYHQSKSVKNLFKVINQVDFLKGYFKRYIEEIKGKK